MRRRAVATVGLLLGAVFGPFGAGADATHFATWHPETVDRAALIDTALAELPPGGTLTSSRTYERPPGYQAPSRATSAGYHSPAGYQEICHGIERSDAAGDVAELDIVAYGTFLDCSSGTWVVPLQTDDAWSETRLEGAAWVADTDGNPSTGCSGYEWLAFATYDETALGLSAGLFSTPSCDGSTWSEAPAGVARSFDNDVVLLVDHFLIGEPTQLRWFSFLAATGAAGEDNAPDTGDHVESGIPPASACRNASTDGQQSYYALVDDGAAAAPALRGAGVRAVNAIGRRVVTFSGNPGRAAAALHRAGVSASIHVDHVGTWLDVPDDPLFTRQWELDQIDAPEAWDITHGSPAVRVAVLDSGVDASHPELQGKLVHPYDATTGEVFASENVDAVGHGTATAGLVGALTGNTAGLAAVGWETQVIPVKVGDFPTESAVIAGMDWAADHGARVVNMSFGLCDTATLQTAIADAQQRGALIVASVGNSADEGSPVLYPAGYAGVLGVGATNSFGSRAHYSHVNDSVDIVAPGGSADGSQDTDVTILAPGGGYATGAGTSFSAPIVAAASALLLALQPELTAGQVAHMLADSAIDLGATGWDQAYGWGRLDVDALLVATPPPLAIARPTDDSCPSGAVPEDGFTDVPGGNAHESTIDCVVWWSVARGTSATTYSPGLRVTREQMASFLARLVVESGGTLPVASRDYFADDGTSAHEENINRLAEAGIVRGGADGRFNPTLPVTRDQMASFLVRTFEYRAAAQLSSAGDFFLDDTGNTHELAINRAATAGFTGGRADGGYAPWVAVTRDQMASFLARVLDKLVEDGVTPRPA